MSYDLQVFLKPDAPSGTISEQLTLLTNDQRSPEVPLDVEGRVVAELTVSPASLLMGVLEPGPEGHQAARRQGEKAVPHHGRHVRR